MVEKIQVSTFLSIALDTTGTCCVQNTSKHTPPSQESGAGVRSWKKTALAHFPLVPPAESSFPTLLNKGGLILHGFTHSSAELVLSPTVSARAALPAVKAAQGGSGSGPVASPGPDVHPFLPISPARDPHPSVNATARALPSAADAPSFGEVSTPRTPAHSPSRRTGTGPWERDPCSSGGSKQSLRRPHCSNRTS